MSSKERRVRVLFMLAGAALGVLLAMLFFSEEGGLSTGELVWR